MKNSCDLDAPIKPGQSAAGVHLDDSINDILEMSEPFVITDWSQGKTYQYESVMLWATQKGKVQQISVYSGYRGKLAGVIGIGSTVNEVVKSLGTVVEDDEGNWIVAESAGWCFEIARWLNPQKHALKPTTKVTEIFVFHTTQRRIDHHIEYPTTCPECQRKIRPDLILKDKRGVNSLRISPVLPDEVLGYGRYCQHCGRGWTGDELLKLARSRGSPQ